MKKIFLIDWNAIIYRMFYALPSFTTKEGKHVNAIYGIAKFFLEDLKKENPDYLVFVRDAKWKNFRHEIYSEYKATRDRMPDNLRDQIEDINNLVWLFCNDVVEIPWVEADDVIATLALNLKKDKNNEIYILSWDKDLYSLVWENVKILDIIRKDLFDEKKTKEKFWVEAKFITDYLALVWDSSDNIPWISWIWPKKAVPLINKIWNLEEIYNYIDSQKKSDDEELNKILSWKSLELIKNSREIAFLSKKLATIKNDVLLSKDWFDLEKYKFDENNLLNDKIIELFKSYEFYSLLWENNKKEEKTWQDLWLKVQTVWDKDWLDNLINLINKQKEIVLDTETTSLDVMKAKLVWISILLDEKNIFYINLWHNWSKVVEKDLKNFLENLLNSWVKIIWHNLKYDLEILELFIKFWNIENHNENKIENNFWQISLWV